MNRINSVPLSKEEADVLKINTSVKLLRNTLFGYKSKERGLFPSIMYFIKGLTRELHIIPSLFEKIYERLSCKCFEKRWLKKSDNDFYYDFCGAKLPYDKSFPLGGVFHDTFYFYCLFHDNYSKNLVRKLDPYLNEGAYGYTGDGIDVKVNVGDIVIDAGAWIGDFSAYAVAKSAVVYAFEPTFETYKVLCKTAELNGSEKLYPIKKALGNEIGESYISINDSNYGGNSIAFSRGGNSEKIEITTIDEFVVEKKLSRVDFIKADIEGFERYMLLGAKETLKKYAPKLAICTYHSPEDPKLLVQIVLEANPLYKIVHLKKKMLAQVI